MIHKHHIIPRHMGGGDEVSNILLCTVEEHADAHEALWKEYGKIEDWIAFNALRGTISKIELILAVQRASGGRNKGRVQTQEERTRRSAALLGRPKSAAHRLTMKGRIVSPETRAKISATLSGRPHSDQRRANISAGIRRHD